MLRFTAWVATVVAVGITLAWVVACFTFTCYVGHDYVLSAHRGIVDYLPFDPDIGISPEITTRVSAVSFRVAHDITFDRVMGGRRVTFPLWLFAVPWIVLSVWLWEARLRRRAGFARWGLTFFCVSVGVLWSLSGWTMLTANVPYGRMVSIGDGRVATRKVSEREGRAPAAAFDGPRLESRGFSVRATTHRRETVAGVMSRIYGSAGTSLPLTLGVALPPTVLMWVLTYSSRQPGHCRKCGYDLRGSGDVCPECGSAIGPQAASAGADE